MIGAILPLLKFQPILLPKPWGGDSLWQMLGKGRDSGANIGESWELSDRRNLSTTVTGGRLDGTSLRELVKIRGRELLGDAFAHGFPLLLKFIGAREKLSVQVHPGQGSKLGEAKTECWYVVEAEPGAELFLGVAAHGRSREEILALLKSPRCEEVLQRRPARRGDVFFIPMGTVHVITEGLLLYEIQQNSDTTFRLYDWGRVDAQGNARPLHMDQAALVADLEEREGYKIPSLRVNRDSHSEDYLAACPYFCLMKWHGLRTSARLDTHGKFKILTMVSGSLVAATEDGESIRLKLGDTVLVPACRESVQLESASEDAEVLISFVPDMVRDVHEPLLRAGFDEQAIKALSGPVALPGP